MSCYYCITKQYLNLKLYKRKVSEWSWWTSVK